MHIEIEIIIADPCKKSSLFEHIYMENVRYDKLPLLKMGILFGQMLLHWLLGNKKKYVIHPEWMTYTNYKSISRLGDISKVDIAEYDMCLRKMYDIDKLAGDVILFTAPLLGYFNDIPTLIAKTVDYIVMTYSPNKVIIKKHPRDKNNYVFPENIEVAEINEKLPGELLMQLITCKKHIFMFPSSLLMSYSSYDAIEVLIYKNLPEKNNKYLKNVRGDLASLHITNERVTEI